MSMGAAGLTVTAAEGSGNAGTQTRGAFLAAMARRAASVAVVTVARGGLVHGVTVSSLVSVSADPPTILVSLCRASRQLPPILEVRRFGVSLLAEEQESIARSCANPQRGPLPSGSVWFGADGVPLLTGAAATFALDLAAHVPVADHVLLIGRVHAATACDRAPLLYYDRRYRGLAPQR